MTVPKYELETIGQLLAKGEVVASPAAPILTVADAIGHAAKRLEPGQFDERALAIARDHDHRVIVVPHGLRNEIVVRRSDHRQRTTIKLQLRLRGNRCGVSWRLSKYTALALVRALVKLLDLDPMEL